MPKIHWLRVILGGLAAGLIVNLSEFIGSGMLLREDWERAMLALNRPLLSSTAEIVTLLVRGFLMGLSAVALYAHLIGFYGQGWMTASLAGLAVWVVGYLSWAMTGAAMNIIPVPLAVNMALAGLIEIEAASMAGGAIYRPRR
ncbi:MAG: hypothetical protein C0504_11075 [Candidatus Solibacter sp.]|nr:hypothetical protein [Candidatus Solibacter sp.]